MKRNQSHCSKAVVPLRRSIQLALWLSMVCTAFFVSRHAQAEDLDFDIIIRKGRIVDGTGNPAIHADLAIKGGRIAAIGKVAGTAKQELDADGLIVAPGFIDVHTHAEDIDDQPLGENFLRMGVTTIMLGNCGASALNIGDYFRGLEATTTSPNVATLVGHSTVRRRAMHGSFDRPPTPEELEEMKATVRRGMEEGAFGISTGLIYLPGVFAKTEEIIALAQVAAEFDGIYATHQRSEGDNIRTSLDEIFRIAREARIRAEISHLKLSGPSSWHQAKEILGIIDQARASGLDITQDQYAYTASSTGISQLIPEWMREGGQERFLERMAEPETKAKLVAEMKDKLQKRKSPDYSYAVIAAYRPNPCLNGMNIVEATKLNRPTDSIDHQIEMILEIESNGGASGIFHGMSEEDIQEFMRHPNTMIACDSGVRRFQVDVPHPRGYGNNARVLGQYVREKKILRLEDAIRKMSSLPARTFRIKERGELREGWWADLAIFDAQEVNDPSTFADPHHYSTGFRYVLVNGAVVIDNDRHNGARPGKVLRHMDRGTPSETAPTPVTPSAAVPAQ